MTKPDRFSLLLLALLLVPTLVLAGWALSIRTQRAEQPALRIGVVGFDPRDLLRGHYLQVRLDIGGLAEPLAALGDVPDCVCVTPSAEPSDRPGFAPLPSCQPVDIGQCSYPLANPRQTLRVYVPQSRAADLEEKLRQGLSKLDVEVRFAGDGSIAVGKLAVDGVPVQD
ncbi:GDYXXLXY domain-containing protein [Niveispirillum irakense]|uniref:GDYXXLXY domain-containing protein n=1 Tax=Niveispirillum irakense TaxID=34011 RepID=UPI0004003E6E|nr:GDYXXLXY domain-containing protein [Niveispirillum irakense]